MEKVLIFDMDGTLFQTNTILELSLHATFNYLREQDMWKGSTPIEKYREIMGVPLPIVWETLLPSHAIDVRQKANELFHGCLIRNIQNDEGQLYPNVMEILAYLKEKKFPIFIASNGQSEYLRTIVSHYRLDRWVTETFSIEQIESQKKSDLVAIILEKYQFMKGAVVGDRLSDIEAAKCNGLLAIGCRFDFAQEEELKKADVIIDDLLELKGFL